MREGVKKITLDYIAGFYRIFQYVGGHRFSTDDVLTGWYGTQWAARIDRAADLGSGIGSVAITVAWRAPGATICTVEAQEISVRLARKSIRYNGLDQRFRIVEGDLRDPGLFADEPPFDLVTGSPPYFPYGTAKEARHPQSIPALAVLAANRPAAAAENRSRRFMPQAPRTGPALVRSQ